MFRIVELHLEVRIKHYILPFISRLRSFWNNIGTAWVGCELYLCNMLDTPSHKQPICVLLGPACINISILGNCSSLRIYITTKNSQTNPIFIFWCNVRYLVLTRGSRSQFVCIYSEPLFVADIHYIYHINCKLVHTNTNLPPSRSDKLYFGYYQLDNAYPMQTWIDRWVSWYISVLTKNYSYSFRCSIPLWKFLKKLVLILIYFESTEVLKFSKQGQYILLPWNVNYVQFSLHSPNHE